MEDVPVPKWLNAWLDIIISPQSWPKRLRQFSVVTFPIFYPLYGIFCFVVIGLVIIYACFYVIFKQPIWFLKKMWMCPDAR